MRPIIYCFTSCGVCVSECVSCKDCNGLNSGTLEGCLAGPVVVANVHTFHYLPMVQ